MPWGSSGVAVGGGTKIFLIDGSFVSSTGTSSQTGSYIEVSPTLDTISPQTVTAGSGPVDITLNGRDFSESSVVTWDGQALSISSPDHYADHCDDPGFPADNPNYDPRHSLERSGHRELRGRVLRRTSQPRAEPPDLGHQCFGAGYDMGLHPRSSLCCYDGWGYDQRWLNWSCRSCYHDTVERRSHRWKSSLVGLIRRWALSVCRLSDDELRQEVRVFRTSLSISPFLLTPGRLTN